MKKVGIAFYTTGKTQANCIAGEKSQAKQCAGGDPFSVENARMKVDLI